VVWRLLFVLGNFSLRSGFTIDEIYEFSGNIHPGAPVKVSGIKVGKVEDVSSWAASSTRRPRRVYVRVEAWVENRRNRSARTPSSSSTPPGARRQYRIVPGRATGRPADPPGPRWWAQPAAHRPGAVAALRRARLAVGC
jgi:hypothetical protein